MKRIAFFFAALALCACTDTTAPHGTLAFLQVSASYTHTCGLTRNGAAYCWGDNLVPTGSSMPVAVVGGLTFAAVSAKSTGGYGVTTGGAAYRWPHNGSDSGYGPVAVATGLTLVSVSAGFDHDCGVTVGGAAYCWGDTELGQLGDGTTTGPERCFFGSCSSTPVAVAGGLTFAAVSAGHSHTCGLTTGGAVYCWGAGEGSSTIDSTPVPVAGGLTFAAISAGESHTCGVTSGGVAYCWGSNLYGQLGDGTTTYCVSPTAVSGGLRFTAISAGRWHSCGVTTGGAAYCWGVNDDGQLGAPSGSGVCGYRDRCSTTPVAVGGGLSFSAVSAGEYHTCGLTTAGVAYCWGGNLSGQLGNNSTRSSSTPVWVAGQP